jgi:hypothetical protein
MGDGDAQYPTFPLTVETQDDGTWLMFSASVHEIEVDECFDDCEMRDQYCSVGAATSAWGTGVGQLEPQGAADPRRGPPTIHGPVRYGDQPVGSGYATTAVPLKEGALYTVSAYIYGPCDDDDDVDCFHVDAYGCAYFTGGANVALSDPAAP